jgi:hypothetical protein
MFDTMLRSGVPPHIGHSLPPVSPLSVKARDPDTNASAETARTMCFMMYPSYLPEFR